MGPLYPYGLLLFLWINSINTLSSVEEHLIANGMENEVHGTSTIVRSFSQPSPYPLKGPKQTTHKI